MSKELVINANAEEQEIKIALLDNGKLLELHKEVFNKKFSVGDVYLGVVERILHGLNAAIIDIGHSKGGFLHYNDLGFQTYKNILSLIPDNHRKKNVFTYFNSSEKERIINYTNINSIDDVLCLGQKIIVQVSKEPIYNKGLKLTSKICLPGRNLILIPFSDEIFVSQKIKNIKEKKRLISYIKRIKPNKFGIIIRTAAYNKRLEILEQELFYLINKWEITLNNIIKLPPVQILSEESKIFCFLRDLFNDNLQYIYCNNNFICKEIHSYLSLIAPDKINIIKYYRENIPIFEKYGINKQIQTYLGKNVPLDNGAYIIIEHTEALHVIDVNSGISNHFHKNCTESERTDHVLKINLIAATEIVRQLRLRDMGGIIIVDFIDMSESINKNKLYEYIKEKMKDDRAKHKILPPNEFGLVQFTRHRVRPELKKNNYKLNHDNNISYNYKNYKKYSDYINHIEFSIENIIRNKIVKHKVIQLHIHPFISAYLKKGFPSIQQKWLFNHKKWIKIIPKESLKYTEYILSNEENEIILSSFY
ncbi:Rne/Rng family ribonuclease [Blattabacterium cuenoti]|uniref:Rne/Rng family ribonuclease n=1 Tax=Blattabacterium cuenoti TaxID=1653831 RepID=UPI00163CBDA3|nr:Rne/Rng family ribonuclease [Blattabacterium cuenoti]